MKKHESFNEIWIIFWGIINPTVKRMQHFQEKLEENNLEWPKLDAGLTDSDKTLGDEYGETAAGICPDKDNTLLFFAEGDLEENGKKKTINHTVHTQMLNVQSCFFCSFCYFETKSNTAKLSKKTLSMHSSYFIVWQKYPNA